MNDPNPGSDERRRPDRGWNGAAGTTPSWSGHVIVCGLHAEGLRIVEQLDAAGVAVVMVDDAPEAALVPAVTALGIPLLTGDSRMPETLLEAGVLSATSLICVETDDLHTLATALLAHELGPTARVVVQLRNPAVRKALEGAGVSVLDVAALTAPSIVEACTQGREHSLWLGEEEFVVVDTEVPRVGTLREQYGDLAPAALIDRDTGEVEVSPRRDVPVEAGDRAFLIGPRHELEAAGVLAGSGPVQHAGGARSYREATPRPVALWRSAIGLLDRQLRRALLALVGLIGVSVVVLTFGYHESNGGRMTPLDALYFTIETIATVGYGDFYFRDQQPWLRVWAILLMIVGAVLAALLFALITNLLIGRRIAEALGRRRITGLDRHVVVIGMGTIGLKVVDELQRADVPVVAVDADEHNRYLPQLHRQGAPTVIGDATLPETLASLHLERARGVAVVTSDDLVNLETALSVRDLLVDRWPDTPVVVRLFGRRLARTVQSSFGFSHVRSTAELAAPWFVGAALGFAVISTFYVADELMLVASLDVTGAGLTGVAMNQLGARLRVVSLRRADGTTLHGPRRHNQLRDGDLAYVVGPYEELIALLRG